MNWENQSKQTSFYLQQMEQRIPKDDIFRIIDEKIDLSFIDEKCNQFSKNKNPYYSTLSLRGEDGGEGTLEF